MTADRKPKHSPTPHSAVGPESHGQVHSINVLSARFLCKSTSLASLVLLLSGCTSVANLHPLYSSAVKADEPALEGDWVLDVDNPRPVVQLHPSPLPEGPWTVTITDNGISVKYSGNLLRLGDSLFIELTPEDHEALPRNALMPQAPHSFYRLQFSGDFLLVAPIDSEWVQKHLKRDQFIKSKKEPYKMQIILLASTEELQAFLRLHAANSLAFPIAVPFTRGPAGRPNEP